MEKNIIHELNQRHDEDEIELAVKGGYLTTDSEFLKRDVRGGTCSVTALIVGGNLVVSNAGDCRAVSSKGGVAEALTSDHRPSREDERERIEMLVSHIFCINTSLILFCSYSLVYLAAELRFSVWSVFIGWVCRVSAWSLESTRIFSCLSRYWRSTP